jgi:hypothetical protein
MRRQRPSAAQKPELVPLDGRTLMSVATIKAPQPAPAIVAHRIEQRMTDAPSPGESAVMSALLGGAGHEFVVLAEREIPNPLAVVAGFEGGAIKQYTVPGLVAKITNWQSGYTGFRHDTLALTMAGAAVLKGKKIELAALVRGPFTTYPGTTYIVFAINRGAGAGLGPAFARRPGITPDMLVTVKVGPDGKSNSATITDLTTKTTRPIVSPTIKVAGPTVRILLPTSLLPPKGFTLPKFTFAVWTEAHLNAPIHDVGSFAPEESMNEIGIEPNLSPTL